MKLNGEAKTERTLNLLSDKIASEKCDMNSPYIFISYKRTYKSERVYEDVLKYRELGYNIYIDQSNLSRKSDDYRKAILPVIEGRNCKLVVFYLSKDALLSAPVREELIDTKSELSRRYHDGNDVPVVIIDIDDTVYDLVKVKESIIGSPDYDDESKTQINILFDTIFPDGITKKPRIRPKDYIGRYSTSEQYYRDVIREFDDVCKKPRAVAKDKDNYRSLGETIMKVASLSDEDSRPIPERKTVWGPSRKTYSIDNRACEVTFNSITDNPVVGDERNFVRVGEVGSGKSMGKRVLITPGNDYQIWIYYHNNADEGLNYTDTDNISDIKGIAKQVKISSGLSSWTVSKDHPVLLQGIISSSNANPNAIWDSVVLETDSDEDIVLEYRPASAKIYNNYDLNGMILSDKYLFNEGVYIGCRKIDGYIPAGEKYAGHIIYTLRAGLAKCSYKKTILGRDGFRAKHTVIGHVLTVKTEFINMGTIDLKNVTFKDLLPEGMELIPGTTIVTNNANPNGVKMKDVINSNGFNTGLYGPGAYCTIVYQVRIKEGIGPKTVEGIVAHTRGIGKDKQTVTVHKNVDHPLYCIFDD